MGRLCGCGNRGCLEQYCSGTALVRAAREVAAGAAGRRGAGCSTSPHGDIANIDGPVVTKAAQEGDPAAVDCFDEIGRWLGQGLADLAALLDPGRFVIGGGVAEAGDLLLAAGRETYAAVLTGRGYRPLADVVPATARRAGRPDRRGGSRPASPGGTSPGRRRARRQRAEPGRRHRRRTGDAGGAGRDGGVARRPGRAAASSLVVTHGNGPQVGRILLQQEYAAAQVPPMPMDVCGAQSQGQIGYLLAQTLDTAMSRRGLPTRALCLVTQVVVDGRDPAFRRPTKPVGPSYDRGRGAADRRARPATSSGPCRTRSGGGRWPRRQPLRIVEAEPLRQIVDAGHVVVAAGGGGVPVVEVGDDLHGVEAVIDKDLTAVPAGAAGRGRPAGRSSTEVRAVQVGFGTPKRAELAHLPSPRPGGCSTPASSRRARWDRRCGRASTSSPAAAAGP